MISLHILNDLQNELSRSGHLLPRVKVPDSETVSFLWHSGFVWYVAMSLLTTQHRDTQCYQTPRCSSNINILRAQ